MDSKSLMIGDWVNWKKGNMLTPCKIGIGDLLYVEENAVAIPLTPEILEKNSFKYDGGAIWDIRWDDEDGHHCMNFRKMYRKSNRVWDSLGIMMGGEVTLIKYVHELQHALRLCGLNDLADNFKI